MRVFAMARPKRPARERELVICAAGVDGRVSDRARRLAGRVAAEALADLDTAPSDRIISTLRGLDPSPSIQLAVDRDVDTAALIRAERQRRLESRLYRRLSPAEADAEDLSILEAVANKLNNRYARILRDSRNIP